MLLGTTETIPAKLTKVKYFSTGGIAGIALNGFWTPPKVIDHSPPASEAGGDTLSALLHEFRDQWSSSSLARRTPRQQGRWHTIDVMRQPYPFQAPDEIARNINLPPMQ